VVRLTFTYNFGNNKLKKTKESTETGSDEIKELARIIYYEYIRKEYIQLIRALNYYYP
jgi:hypothetical protein